MTEKEEQEARARWNEAAQAEILRRQQEAQQHHQEMLRQQAQQQAQQQALQRQLMEAQMWAQRTQQAINETPRQQYAVIVAVDERGGFSKDGKIPWYYPEDFKWFQQMTKGHICVMGRTTYDDINARLGDKAAESVLPSRRCFVVTSTPLPRANAIAVASISDVDKHLTFADADNNITVFFIGGERIYREGIAKATTAYITIVNKDVDADRFFPVGYIMKHFAIDKTFQNETAPDLRFTVWRRNP
jgi:dihydrofolate reductase